MAETIAIPTKTEVTYMKRNYNFFYRIKNLFVNWFECQKEHINQQREKDIRDSFSLKENGETLCISHSGDIIHAYTSETTVREILRELNAKRDTAVKFAKI